MYSVEPFLGNSLINTFPQQRISMQQLRNCCKRRFLLSPCIGAIRRTVEARIVQLYPHRSLASRRRRLIGNPVPGGITGSPCHLGAEIQRPGPPCPPGWELEARLTTSLQTKKNNVVKSREVKTGWPHSRRNRQVWQYLLRQWFSTGAMPYFGEATGKSQKNGWELLSEQRKFHF
jgi:hypothetical protein